MKPGAGSILHRMRAYCKAVWEKLQRLRAAVRAGSSGCFASQTTSFFAYLWIIAFLLAGGVLSAQSEEQGPEVTLATPHNTIYSHLYYLQPENYRPELAARTLYGVADSARAVELAIWLKQIYDGLGLYVPVQSLPRTPDYTDTLGRPRYAPFPDELPEVYVEKINGKWYYSEATVKAIPRLHREVFPLGADLFVRLMPRWGQRKVLGLALWQYVGLGLLIFVTWLVHQVLRQALRPVLRGLARMLSRVAETDPRLILRLSTVLSALLLLLLFRALLPALLLPISFSRVAMLVLRLAITLTALLLVLRVWDLVVYYLRQAAARTESRLDDQLLPILQKGGQVLIVLAGIIQVLRVLHVDVTALIAGVSIGGLAIALAAQDTVKNLIGSLMILIDQPFQVGDYVVAEGYEGTILEVGFRSTRILQIDSSVVTIPNGNLVNASVRNLGVRVFRLLNIKLGVTYDTPPELLEKFIEGLRRIILDHPRTRKEGYYVHFIEFADFSLNIMVRAQIEVRSYADELQVKEELLMSFLRLAAELGVQYAFPTQTILVEQLPGAGSLSPEYTTDPDELEARMQRFLEAYRKRYAAQGQRGDTSQA